MTTKYLFIHNSSYRQAVETVCECFPKLDVIPPFACQKTTKCSEMRHYVQQNIISVWHIFLLCSSALRLQVCAKQLGQTLSFHTYIHHRIHISYWWRHIHGFLWEERSSLDIWFCRKAASRWSPMTACLGLHSLPETGNCSLEDILHTQRAWAGRSTDHEHPL